MNEKRKRGRPAKVKNGKVVTFICDGEIYDAKPKDIEMSDYIRGLINNNFEPQQLSSEKLNAIKYFYDLYKRLVEDTVLLPYIMEDRENILKQAKYFGEIANGK